MSNSVSTEPAPEEATFGLNFLFPFGEELVLNKPCNFTLFLTTQNHKTQTPRSARTQPQELSASDFDGCTVKFEVYGVVVSANSSLTTLDRVVNCFELPGPVILSQSKAQVSDFKFTKTSWRSGGHFVIRAEVRTRNKPNPESEVIVVGKSVAIRVKSRNPDPVKKLDHQLLPTDQLICMKNINDKVANMLAEQNIVTINDLASKEFVGKHNKLIERLVNRARQAMQLRLENFTKHLPYPYCILNLPDDTNDPNSIPLAKLITSSTRSRYTSTSTINVPTAPQNTTIHA
eukprot:c18916_g1_i1.p1 GENE.c18916_g1_i1~~c18916_g1_i1.p1  ORF type:complete len:289 (-),score=28.72 c18916_g1_i1:294-1160(-)